MLILLNTGCMKWLVINKKCADEETFFRWSETTPPIRFVPNNNLTKNDNLTAKSGEAHMEKLDYTSRLQSELTLLPPAKLWYPPACPGFPSFQLWNSKLTPDLLHHYQHEDNVGWRIGTASGEVWCVKLNMKFDKLKDFIQHKVTLFCGDTGGGR